MAYDVTISGTTIAVTASQIGTQGPKGDTGAGFTGGSYDSGTGVVTFTSGDGLGFSTGDLRGADGLTVNWVGDWALSTAYAVNDAVANNGSSYICIQAHTSSATDEPGVGANTATYWDVLAEKGADGAGAGTVTSIGVAGGTGIDSSGGPVTSSGTITVGLNAATVASLALADSALQPTVHDTLTAGFDSDVEALGTISSGTVTPEVDANTKENFKSLTNNGAFTLAPPSTSSACTILIQVTNGASAGTITTSGFTIVNGDTYATTNGNDYFFHIKKVGAFSSLTIEALQ